VQSLFREVMQRIKESGCEPHVISIFSWIINSCRPLTGDEISEAVSVSVSGNLNGPHFNTDELVEMCQCLVIAAADGSILFVHNTISDIVRSHCGSQVFSLAKIANVCLSYLGLDVFDEECLDEGSVKARVEKYKFIQYVAVYWSKHVKDAEKDLDVQSAVFSLSGNETKRTAMRRMEQYVTSGYEDIDIEPVLVLMAGKDLPNICRIILERTTPVAVWYAQFSFRTNQKFRGDTDRRGCLKSGLCERT
jgi:hypothetical protein